MGNHQRLGGASMNTQEHLNRIKAKCQELLAIAEKRTDGEWRILDADDECPGIEAGKTSIVIWGGEDDEAGVRTGLSDATFIASCAGAAEAGWRATAAAIDGLEAFDKWCRTWTNTNGCSGAAIQYVHEQRERIIAAWPQELL
jgi:hypothetical protein